MEACAHPRNDAFFFGLFRLFSAFLAKEEPRLFPPSASKVSLLYGRVVNEARASREVPWCYISGTCTRYSSVVPLGTLLGLHSPPPAHGTSRLDSPCIISTKALNRMSGLNPPPFFLLSPGLGDKTTQKLSELSPQGYTAVFAVNRSIGVVHDCLYVLRRHAHVFPRPLFPRSHADPWLRR